MAVYRIDLQCADPQPVLDWLSAQVPPPEVVRTSAQRVGYLTVVFKRPEDAQAFQRRWRPGEGDLVAPFGSVDVRRRSGRNPRDVQRPGPTRLPRVSGLNLTATDKKLLKQLLSFPWPADLPSPVNGPMEALSDDQLDDVLRGYAPLEDQLGAAVERFRRSAPQQMANVGPMHPNMSERQLRNWLADTCLDLDNRGGVVAIARRFLADDPEELIRFGVVGTRMSWALSGHGREGCAVMWAAVLGAIAIGDALALERLLTTLPTMLDEAQAYPFLPHSIPTYNAVLSLVRGDFETARRFIKQLESRRLPKNEAAIATCLRGIIDGSSRLVAEGLEVRAASVRKVKALDPHFKLFDETLHGLYQLCQRIEPGLTTRWDTRHCLPWDAEFHERLQAGGDPMRTVDLSGLPERQRILLVELPVPDWWSGLS